MNNIGAKIKQLRKQGDVTQEKLAETLGVTGQAVSRWENENDYPDIEYITPIAKYFNVSTDYLFDYSSEGTSTGSRDFEKRLQDIAERLKSKGMRVKDIAEVTGLSVEKIMHHPNDMMTLIHVEPIRLCFGYNLISLVDASQGGDLLERMVEIRRNIALELGSIIPMIRVQDNTRIGPNEYAIYIKGTEVAAGTILPDKFMAINSGITPIEDDLDGIETADPIIGRPAKWITDSQREQAKDAGYTVVDPAGIMATHLTESVRKHLHELLSRQDVHHLVNNIKENHPVLVDELIPNHMSIGDVQKVLAKLLKEGVSIRDLVSILDTLADYAPVTHDTDMLTEYVRASLRRPISKKFFPNSEHKVITLAPELEKSLTDNIKKTEMGSFVSISQEASQRLFDNLKIEADKLINMGEPPIVLTSPFVRMYFKQLVEEIQPDLVVLSYGEIDHTVRVHSVGMVAINK